MKKIILFIFIIFTIISLTYYQSYPADNDKEFDNGSSVTFPEMNTQVIENLELLGKLWGFLKYYHPEIGNGKYNWDYELFRILPSYLNSTSIEQRDKILLDWLKKLGDIPACNSCKETQENAYLKPDFSWLNDGQISSKFKKNIERIYQNRHQGKHYYIAYDKYGNPTFLHENTYSNMPYPDQGFRLLSLYRFWNYIQYFSPYINLTDKNWNIVLKEYIPQFLNAKNELEYELVALRLITETNDTHAGSMPIGNKIAETRGKLFPPFKVRFVENQLIVYEFYNPEKQRLCELKIGDIITHISGKSVKSIIDSVGQYYPASNNASKLRDISFNILRSDEQFLEIQYITDKQTKITNLKLFSSDSLNLFKKYDEKCFKTIDKNIGYITLRSIKNEDISIIRSTFKDAKGIIIDIRDGASEYVPYLLGSFFINKATPFAKVSIGNINNLGEFQFSEVPTISADKEPYKGKLVVIVNEYTQSMGEFTAMAFRAGLNTTIIGSTTAGTDGTARQIILPGNLKTRITGYGVFYPDGKQTQRVGIVPDIIISPTIEGIKNGKDEVLDMAIEIINNE
jgi:C-terminal processing protease CtpA/Prc